MSPLTFSAIWCAVQVCFLCATVVPIVQILLNRRPQLASRVAAGSFTVVLLVTLLIPLQFPAADVPVSILESTDGTRLPSNSADPTAITSLHSDTPADPFFPETIHIDFRRIIARVQLLQKTPVSLAPRVGTSLLIVLWLGVSLGLIQLGIGLTSLWLLRRHSLRLEDESIRATTSTLLRGLQTSGLVEIRESSRVDCAAVVGFLRPIVVLSPQWRTWSNDELRAVLAHELAHLSRRDSVWRLVASVCSAVHFYNPMMRWLVSRLVLAQELAADERAISLVGERGCYLRSLSRLALCQDGGMRVRAQPLFTPVFSGHWIRRIEMLRAMDCTQHHSRGWWSKFLVASLVLFGLATTAIRAWAQMDDERAGQQPNADSPVVSVSTITSEPATADSNWQLSLFKREKLSGAQPIFSERGAFHLDLAALRRSKFFGDCIDACVSLVFADFGAPEHWDIRALESVTANVHVELRSAPNAPKGHKNQVMLGSSALLFRTDRDIDWKGFLYREIPSLEAKTVDGQELLEGPFPAVGPIPVRLYPVNPRALVFGLPLRTKENPDNGSIAAAASRRIGGGETDPQTSPAFIDEWTAVSGGVLSFVAVIPKSEPPLNFDDMEDDMESEGVEGIKDLSEGIDLVSLGIDVGSNDPLVEGRIRLRCRENVNSRAILSTSQRLLQLALKQYDPTGTPSPGQSEWLAALQSARIELVPGSRDVVDCRFRVVISDSLLQMIKSVGPSIAPQQAERSDSESEVR